MDRNASQVAPKQLLSVGDGIFLTIGMIVGALIFKAPSTVAGATSSNAEFLFAWLLGGLVSLCGALVYAELAARHPDVGGEYMFLRRGWGHGVAFVFAWSRMTVIQTGAIAAVAFVFGDYASEIVALGKGSSAIWAAIAVAALTALNLAGTLHSKTLQKVMEARSKVFAAREAQNIPELGQAEGALRATLGHLFALAEAYPDLKTNQSFQQLQARISGLENGIADRREFYNESVNVNNVRIEQFPDTIIAGMFNFKPAHLLEFREAEKADVDMKQLFGS